MRTIPLLVASGLLLGAAVASVSAQDAAITVLGTPSEQAQIDALVTQVAALTTRVARLEGERASAGTTSAAPTPSTVAAEPTAVALGEAATADRWSIIVKSTEPRDQFQSDKPVLPHGIFLIVQMDVTNTGSDPQEFPWRDLRIGDGAGRTFGPSSDATITYYVYELDSNDISSDLQPSLTYAFPVVFDLPPDATNLILTSSERAFAAKLDR